MHALGDADADRLFLTGVSEAFEEDRTVLEAQQRLIDRHGDSWPVALKADSAAIQARHVLDQLIAREHRAGAATLPAHPESAVIVAQAACAMPNPYQ